jgi:hypothetical protein
VPEGPSARRRRRAVVAAAIAIAVASAGAVALAAATRPLRRDAPPDGCFAAEPDRCFVSHGAWVELGRGVVRDRAAVDRALTAALAYWSAPPDALARWLVTFEDHEVECNGERATGCTSWRRGTMRLQVLDPRCPETAQVVHEVGHVVLHDAGHRDAAWCRSTEQEATRALVRGLGASAGCRTSGYYVRPEARDGSCGGPAPHAR